MNRDEILARSRNENINVLDEREKAVQTKANSISQGVGMILCILIGAIGIGMSGRASHLWGCTVIYWGMFAAERIAFAAKLRSKGQWFFAGILTLGFIIILAVYVLSLARDWRIVL